MADKLRMASADIVDENIEFIASRWPNAVMEVEINGKLSRRVDFDVLKQELSKELISDKQERYTMTWPDKKNSTLLANSSVALALRPLADKSIEFANTENVFIEGDNLDAMKLLRETYLNKIRMIYIDPPYNTGKDFLYKDDFTSDADAFLQNSLQKDSEGNRLVSNSEVNGRYHTDWLNMIYPRLKIAKDLLTDDGVIFISIDENEFANLKKVCDEVFGEENLLTIQNIQVRYASKSLNERRDFQECLEYVFVYAKNHFLFTANRPFDEYDLSSFKFVITENTAGEKRTIDGRDCYVFRKGEWNISETKGMIGSLKETWVTGSIYSGTGHGKIYQKFVEPFMKEDGCGALYKVIGLGEDGLGYRYFSGPQKEGATKGKMFTGVPTERIKEIQNGSALKYKPIPNFYDFAGDFGNIRLEGGVPFNSGKKPIKMLKQFINYLPGNDFIILDFFAGSASTAHAVMSANMEDNGKRKFIMVQLPETCDETSDAFKNGYKYITDLSEDRIRKSSNQLKTESPLLANSIDLGMRVFKVDSSNMKDVYYNPSLASQSLLEQEIDNVKDDRTPLDLLFQVMLEMGIELSAHIDEKEVNGKKFYVVNDSDLVACFDEDINDDIVKAIAEIKPIYAVFRDSSFKNDSSNINCEQLFKVISPATEIKVI